MDVQSTQLEVLVQQIAETVLTTTETVEKLCQQIDLLTKQVQQQGYQIFALSDAVQTLAENQDNSLDRLGKLTDTLQRLVEAIEDTEAEDPSAIR